MHVRKQSKRQKIIAMLATGHSRGEIISRLGVSENFVRQTIWQVKATVKAIIAEGDSPSKPAPAKAGVSEGVNQ